ncbi:MAG: multidrug transporter [SAR116 cluster bacterium]|nr:multidrug transporter [SAR116 cluster bacterium]
MLNGHQDRALLGIGLMLGAYFLFSFIDASAKWLGQLGLPALQLAFMRYFGHFVISTGLVGLSSGGVRQFIPAHLGLVMFRGALLMGSTVLNFFAVTYLPLTLTSTILFSAPIIICFLSWPLLGERVGIYRWSAIMLGFFGVVVAIRPFDDSFHWAVLLSLGGAVCFALYSILTRGLAGRVDVDVMQFWSGAFGTFCLLPFAVYSWRSPDLLSDWMILIMLGFFGWSGHQLLTKAHNLAPASMLTPFGYSFILFLTIWSYAVFDHLPDKWTVMGALIIVVSGLVIWFRELLRSRYKDVQTTGL